KPSNPNTRVVLDRDPFYAMAVGPSPDLPPDTTHPLLALVGLNYVGAPSVHGALFFDCLTPSGVVAPEGDLVYVIPLTGEFVVDALEGFSAENTARDKAAWQET